MNWSIDDVTAWLLRNRYTDYRRKFKENGIDGPHLIELNPEDIEAMGLEVCTCYCVSKCSLACQENPKFLENLQKLKNQVCDSQECAPARSPSNPYQGRRSYQNSTVDLDSTTNPGTNPLFTRPDHHLDPQPATCAAPSHRFTASLFTKLPGRSKLHVEERFPKPSWITRSVSHEYNSNLKAR